MLEDKTDLEIWQEGRSDEEIEFEGNLRALLDLLDDPHPGLSTWTRSRVSLAQEIYEFLASKFDG